MTEPKRTLLFIDGRQVPVEMWRDVEPKAYADLAFVVNSAVHVTAGIQRLPNGSDVIRILVQSKSLPEVDDFDVEDFYMVYPL